MAYLLIFLGFVLIAVTGKHVMRQFIEKDVFINQQRFMEQVARRLSILEDKVAALEKSAALGAGGQITRGMEEKLEILNQTVSNLERKLDNFWEIGNREKPSQELKFSSYVKEAEKDSLFRDIRAAYDAGKSITEIAEEFGRGKGEVELILNLRR